MLGIPFSGVDAKVRRDRREAGVGFAIKIIFVCKSQDCRKDCYGS